MALKTDAGFHPQAEDVLIAVMGATGSGKTTFISKLVEEDVGIGHGLKSATKTSTAYTFLRPSGYKFTLIDTPGFNDTTLADSEVLRDIAFILTQTYHRGIRLTGIIYLHRITDVRVSGSNKKMMKIIQDLVGEEAFPRLVLASTMWEALEDGQDAHEVAVRREAELQFTEDFWATMSRGGSKLMRWDGSQDSAMVMVDWLSSLQSKSGRIPLQIQREMVDLNLDLSDTKAGRTVNANINELATKLRREKGMLDTRFLEEKALRQEEHDQELAFMRENCKRTISEAKKARDELKVNFDALSKEKSGEYEDTLQSIAQDVKQARSRREEKQLENAQVNREKAEWDELCQTELEYNEARLKDINNRIEHLKAHGEAGELNTVLQERKCVNEVYKEFLKQHQARELEKRRGELEAASLGGEEARLGRMQLAVQGLGVLAGVGLAVAGAVTGIIPLIGGGVSLASSSVSTIAQNRCRN